MFYKIPLYDLIQLIFRFENVDFSNKPLIINVLYPSVGPLRLYTQVSQLSPALCKLILFVCLNQVRSYRTQPSFEVLHARLFIQHDRAYYMYKTMIRTHTLVVKLCSELLAQDLVEISPFQIELIVLTTLDFPAPT